jgi:hypothetical protein
MWRIQSEQVSKLATHNTAFYATSFSTTAGFTVQNWPFFFFGSPHHEQL